jgi:hypothetical protein
VRVTVTPDDGDDASGSVDLSVTEAVYELFTGRLPPEDVRDGQVIPGATVWFRKRGK